MSNLHSDGERRRRHRRRSPTGSPRPSSERHSQLVVGLDPRLDLLPLELRGDAHVGRPAAAEATARFCCGIVDAVAPYVVAVKPQLAFFEVLGSDGLAAFERVVGYARSAGLLVIVDGKRGDIGSTARAYADAYLEPSEGREPARRRADRQPVPRPRLARAVRRRLPARRRRDLLPRQDLERRLGRRPGPRALRRPAALAPGRRARARAGRGARRRLRPLERRRRRRRDAPARGRRGAAAAAAGDPAPAGRRRAGRDARPTSRARSRAGRRARSSTPRARSCTPSGRARISTGVRPRPPRPRG